MTLKEFNDLPEARAVEELMKACHSTQWASRIAWMRPYKSLTAVMTAAESVWKSLSEQDWLEAFDAHPKIGDMTSLKAKYENTEAMAAGEQKGVGGANHKTLEELSALNQKYFEKCGFIFIVFATGKTASQILALLKERLSNAREVELQNAAAEQLKITHLRLEKFFEPNNNTHS